MCRLYEIVRKCALLALTCVVLMAAGCSERDDDKPKIRSRQGIASKIDLDNRVVSMLIANKDGESIELKGSFRDDTVVVINGRTQSIQDIRPGDKVEVEGYKEGEGLNMKWIAIRVTVDRPESSDWKTTGKSDKDADSRPAPTTQPANG